MQVRDVMTRMIAVARPETTLKEAAEKMRALDIGALPVCEGAKVEGVVTDRDIVIRAVAEGRDPSTVPVRDVMTREAFFVYDDQEVKDAGKLMSDLQVRRLIVLDRDGGIAGILSLGDLAIDTGDDKMAGKVLNKVSQPTHDTGERMEGRV